MKLFNTIGLIVALGIIGYHFCTIDYYDLGSKSNSMHYIQIAAMTLIALSFRLGIGKNKNKS